MAKLQSHYIFNKNEQEHLKSSTYKFLTMLLIVKIDFTDHKQSVFSKYLIKEQLSTQQDLEDAGSVQQPSTEQVVFKVPS